jgi:hypothetical protein
VEANEEVTLRWALRRIHDHALSLRRSLQPAVQSLHAQVARVAAAAHRRGRQYGKGAAVDRSVRLARVVPVRRARTNGASPSPGVVVEVSGARISLSRGFDAELLAEVVRALETLR